MDEGPKLKEATCPAIQSGIVMFSGLQKKSLYDQNLNLGTINLLECVIQIPIWSLIKRICLLLDTCQAFFSVKPNLPKEPTFENGLLNLPFQHSNRIAHRHLKTSPLKCWKVRFSINSTFKNWFQGKFGNSQSL